jgi:hypothetical protein
VITNILTIFTAPARWLVDGSLAQLVFRWAIAIAVAWVGSQFWAMAGTARAIGQIVATSKDSVSRADLVGALKAHGVAENDISTVDVSRTGADRVVCVSWEGRRQIFPSVSLLVAFTVESDAPLRWSSLLDGQRGC